MSNDLSALQVKYNNVYARLAEKYGEPEWQPHHAPIDELVMTILSQATSDLNRDKGYTALKAKYPDWPAVMSAPTAELVETIRSAGLANQKGPRIQGALQHIMRERGVLSLDFLADMPVADAMQWLTNIKGVGKKTAAIVLLFAFGRPAFPVDTHVHRITRRLGLIGPKVTAVKAHDLLEKRGDPKTFYPIHLNFIQHGRETCQARNPHCQICVLQLYCDEYAQRQTLVGKNI